MRLELDNYSRVIMTVITVLLTFIAAGLCLDKDMCPAAYGQRLSSAQQRLILVRELERANQKLEEIRDVLIKGQIKVSIAADEVIDD